MSDFDELKEGLLEPVHAFDHALEQHCLLYTSDAADEL